MKLLIVEDDADQLEVRTMLFQEAGFDCISASDAQSAESLARQHAPDCVLMDIGLPNESEGAALISALRQLPSSPNIVVLTGRHAFRHDAVYAVIEKGTRTAVLIETVKRACRTSAVSRATLPR